MTTASDTPKSDTPGGAAGPPAADSGRPTLANVIHIAALKTGQTPLKSHEIFRLRVGLAIASEIKRLGMSFEETQEALVGVMGDTLDLIMAGQQVRRQCAIRLAESAANEAAQRRLGAIARARAESQG